MTERSGAEDAGLGADDALARYCPAELRQDVRTLAPLLYADLKRLAHRERARLLAPNTLQTTALLHEAYVRLSSSRGFESRVHFLRVSAVTMRHVLINHLERRRTLKRGGELRRVDFEEAADEAAFEVADADAVIAIHEALLRLAQLSPRLAEVVECRFFGGLSESEIAAALGVTERTVRRDWTAARAWLARELGEAISVRSLAGPEDAPPAGQPAAD